jgi:hypothetical protein
VKGNPKVQKEAWTTWDTGNNKVQTEVVKEIRLISFDGDLKC